jgi:hypothetical protein
MYTPAPFKAPDFDCPIFRNASDADVMPAPADGIVPNEFHATSIFPEYIKIEGD